MFDRKPVLDTIQVMTLAIIVLLCIIGSAVAGFAAGVANANSSKVKAVKSVARSLKRLK